MGLVQGVRDLGPSASALNAGSVPSARTRSQTGLEQAGCRRRQVAAPDAPRSRKVGSSPSRSPFEKPSMNRLPPSSLRTAGFFPFPVGAARRCTSRTGFSSRQAAVREAHDLFEPVSDPEAQTRNEPQSRRPESAGRRIEGQRTPRKDKKARILLGRCLFLRYAGVALYFRNTPSFDAVAAEAKTLLLTAISGFDVEST